MYHIIIITHQTDSTKPADLVAQWEGGQLLYRAPGETAVVAGSETETEEALLLPRCADITAWLPSNRGISQLLRSTPANRYRLAGT